MRLSIVAEMWPHKRRVYTLPAPIKKAHTEGVLQIRNYFRNGRLRNSKLRSGLGHVAALGNCGKHIQVPQLEAFDQWDLPNRFF